MRSSTFGHDTDWNEVIKKELRGRNDANLGEVVEVREDIVVTERGTLNKEKFYLPNSIPHRFNGYTLLFDIIEDDAKDSFNGGAVQTVEAKTRSMGEEVSTGEDNETAIHTAEEKLAVSKKEAIQEASLIKEPIRQTKTIQVQLKHEELVIEKRLVEKRSTSSNSEDVIRSKTEITIPLKKEDIIVEKKPYVNEEVVINKKPVSETKSISEQFISEKVNVKTDEGVENGARE